MGGTMAYGAAFDMFLYIFVLLLLVKLSPP
jgi:hypothetical protein